MSSDHLATFCKSASAVCTVERTTAGEVAAAITDAVEQPAVGTPLPYEGVSLSETPVETTVTPRDIERAATGVTPVSFAIAEYGSIVIPSTPEGSELLSLYAPRHVAVVAASDIEPGMDAAYERISSEEGGRPQSQVVATGASATADMGTLVQGVHGPHDVHVIVVEDR